MAGFDFEFTYTDPQESIVRACLAAARFRARTLRISWRWRTVGQRHLYVRVDGNSRRMDLLGYRLERDLPLISEGCGESSIRPQNRRRLGRGFADLVLRGRNTEEEPEGPMPLRAVTDTRYYYPPYEYECPRFPLLHARLAVTVELIVGWNFNEIPAEALLEELHAACELTLEELVNRRSKRLSFADLVSTADSSKLFDRSQSSIRPNILLTELKDLRKGVRHRAAAGARPWLEQHWENVAIVLEELVSRLNQSLVTH